MSYADPEAAAPAAAAAQAQQGAEEGAAAAAAPRLFLPFDGTDVKGRAARQLKRGDAVEFQVATDARSGKRRAVQARPRPRACCFHSRTRGPGSFLTAC